MGILTIHYDGKADDVFDAARAVIDGRDNMMTLVPALDELAEALRLWDGE